MLVYTREKLLNHLEQVPTLVDLYQQRDPSFASAVIAWMEGLEETLGQVRSPLLSLVAAERGRILATGDGWSEVSSQRHMTTRKALQVSAYRSLERVQEDVRKRITEIDLLFATWREKMAQFLAVATSRTPIPLPATEPRDGWLNGVWSQLNVNNELQGMYRYLCAAMQPADRLWLLDEVLSNLLAALPSG